MGLKKTTDVTSSYVAMYVATVYQALMYFIFNSRSLFGDKEGLLWTS